MKGRRGIDYRLATLAPLVLEGEAVSHLEWGGGYLTIADEEIENAIVRHFYGTGVDQIHPNSLDSTAVSLGRMRITVALLEPEEAQDQGDDE